MSDYSFFDLDGTTYVPLDLATSAWKPTDISGPAIVGALARSLELDTGVESFQPARITIDLFRAVEKKPFEVRTEIVRDGNRIRVADAFVVQDGETKTRASLVQLRRGEMPEGTTWTPRTDLNVPRQFVGETMPDGQYPLYHTEGNTWSSDMGAHQNRLRKATWHRPIDVVSGEPGTAFQRTVVFAEGTSLMTNWGDEGIGFINADLTVSLVRLPHSEDLGMEADFHVEADGLATGTTRIYDRDGVIGCGSVVAVSNAKRQIDWTSEESPMRQFDIDGRNV